MEFGRTQQYLGFAGDAYRVVGLWNSQPGSYFHAYVQHRWVVPVLLHCAWGMLWYGRHGYCLEFDADSHANANAHPTPSRLGNISTRGLVQTGSGVTIAGFILTGTDLKQVVVRGLGPTLTQFGVSGALADPTLQLVDSTGKTLFINDNWKDTQQAGIQATGLAPPNDLESAIRIALQPGNYTAILSGKNNTTGVGLVEVYDISTGVFAELTNVSTRGFVGTDQQVMIGGFITERRQWHYSGGGARPWANPDAIWRILAAYGAPCRLYDSRSFISSVLASETGASKTDV